MGSKEMDTNNPSCRCLACGSTPSPPSTNNIKILIGILSAPRSGARRRAAIRTSWLQWPEVGKRLLPCFGLGSRDLPQRKRRSFDAADVLWLDVEEIGVLSIPKVFAWWRAAATAMHHFTHAMKVDDDSFVHVPNLLQELAAQSVGGRSTSGGDAAGAGHATVANIASVASSTRPPLPSPTSPLCFGPLAHAGYKPDIFRMCGWSWQRSLGAWRRQRCETRGFSTPVSGD